MIRQRTPDERVRFCSDRTQPALPVGGSTAKSDACGNLHSGGNRSWFAASSPSHVEDRSALVGGQSVCEFLSVGSVDPGDILVLFFCPNDDRSLNGPFMSAVVAFTLFETAYYCEII